MSKKVSQEEQEYTVSISVQGRFKVSVPIAASMTKEEAIQYALEKANEEASNADFGQLEDIEWETDHIEDEDEDFIYPEE